MVILGIDPGIALVGWGVLNSENGKTRVVDFGCIKTTSDMKTEDRLRSVFLQLDEIIKKYKPGAMAVEELLEHQPEDRHHRGGGPGRHPSGG